MRIELPSGLIVHKFGVASGKSAKERMLQINGSIFDKFRETAKIRIVRDREIPSEDVFKMENTLHRFFKYNRYTTKHTFDGVTECFVLPTNSEDAVQAYEAVIEGNVPDFFYEMPEIVVDEYGLPF